MKVLVALVALVALMALVVATVDLVAMVALLVLEDLVSLHVKDSQISHVIKTESALMSSFHFKIISSFWSGASLYWVFC